MRYRNGWSGEIATVNEEAKPVNKIPYVYSGFQRREQAEAFAKAINDKGGNASVVERQGFNHPDCTKEVIVISIE